MQTQPAPKHPALPLLRRIFLPLLGLASLAWFLVRVIPKPSRAAYPCMRAAAPLASGFVLWLLSLGGAGASIRQARLLGRGGRMVPAAAFLVLGIGLGSLGLGLAAPDLIAAATALSPSPLEGPNQPMGTGFGIHPGRVTWVHDPEAVDQTLPPGSTAWYSDDAAPQAGVDALLSAALRDLAGGSNDREAWDRLFRDFNRRHGKGDVPYRPGEKVVIKINLNGLPWGRGNINTSPQVCQALLTQLIGVAGVDPKDITIGDPAINMDPDVYGRVMQAAPGVHYWTFKGKKARIPSTGGDTVFAGDGGNADPLPLAYVQAAYLINVPVLKKHHRAGISLAAKNHFGSITPYNGNGAFNWHYSLPVPDGGGRNTNGGYGVYRCLVDFTGHKDLGGKTLLYLVDGLWGSINWGHPGVQWRMAPFNGTWPASLFASQDPVALESVGFDLLRSEFDPSHPTEGSYDPRDDHGPFAQYKGIDDWMHQAASRANWPKGLVYDPEHDGTPLPDSLGVHEHWNNMKDMQYSRNLGRSEGIDLSRVEL